MKKTITAHLCGIIFTFEEEAYELLERYLAAIRLQLGKSPDVQEIMTDIEARIAELCNEHKIENRLVITTEIIAVITEKLGDPSVFGTGEEQEFEEPERKIKKRFFRHPNDQMIGGVCGGIAAYVNLDSIWVRILFILFTVIFGVGLPIYFVLWLVVPEAKTTAEKLQMQGEDINIENIKRKVSDEKEAVKKRWENLNNDIKNKNWRNNFERFFYKIFSVIGTILSGIVKLLGGVFSFIFFIISLVMICVVLSLVSGHDFMTINGESVYGWWNYDYFSALLLNSGDYQTLFLVGCVIVLLVPCTALIMLGARLLGGMKKVPQEFKISMFISFIVGCILIAFSGFNVAKEFNTRKSITQTEVLTVTSDTLTLDIFSDNYFSNHVTNHHNEEFELIQIDDQQIIFGYPLVNVLSSDDDSFRIKVKKRANGFNQKEAIERAENISYEYDLKGNTIFVQPCFSTALENKWRNQQVYVTIEVPVGKTIKLNKLTDRVIYDVANVTNTHDSNMVNHHWTMANNGLTCVDCD
ncbi:MAG: phage shock protein PspC (stress-responsive transcriptional regulator) [Flavobacteriales bacterium]|jgi:phage shock protein PspC (stress-responsive transcriptional regulator)